MFTVVAKVVGTCLQITCTGFYGVGSEGTSTGRLVRDTIKRFMDCDTDRPSEIVIDFTSVDYIWGDGPGWSVMPWARQLSVTYLVSDRNEEALRELFSSTRLDKFLKITITQVKDA